MARKYDKEQLIAEWEAGGITQSMLAHKHNVSRSLVAKIVNGKKHELKELVEKKTEVDHALKQLSDKKVTAVTEQVTKQLKLLDDIQLFSSKAIKKASSLLDTTESGQELRNIVEAVDKVSVTNKINERHPKQANNIQVSGSINFSAMTDSDLEQQLKEVNERVISTQ